MHAMMLHVYQAASLQEACVQPEGNSHGANGCGQRSGYRWSTFALIGLIASGCLKTGLYMMLAYGVQVTSQQALQSRDTVIKLEVNTFPNWPPFHAVSWPCSRQVYSAGMQPVASIWTQQHTLAPVGWVLRVNMCHLPSVKLLRGVGL